jgi:hypothetical protein
MLFGVGLAGTKFERQQRTMGRYPGEPFWIHYGLHIYHRKVIFSGDFFQLPPVADSEWGVKVPTTLAFDSKSWYHTVRKPVVLKKVFRQKDQGTKSSFIGVLARANVASQNSWIC